MTEAEIDRNEVAARYANGESLRSIARSLHRRREVVKKILAEVGASVRRSGGPSPQATSRNRVRPSDQQLFDLYHRQGKSGADIAELCEVAPQTVYNWLKSAGIRCRDASTNGLNQYRAGRLEQLKEGPFSAALRQWHEIPENHNILRNECKRFRCDPERWIAAQRKGDETRRRPRSKRCAWCGAWITRKESKMGDDSQRLCDLRCKALLVNHRRWHPDSPRPFIVEALVRGVDASSLCATSSEKQAAREVRENARFEAELAKQLRGFEQSK